MARVFVSYSRKNIKFCRQLAKEFQKRDVDIWVDWEGIPPTVDWMEEIERGIEDADTFLAIVSPDWIASKVCQDELNIAVKNGKRLIPVVPDDIVWEDVPASLAHLNFIFFTPNFDFNQQLNTLFTALDTDYEWLKTQRRLQVKALEWERANKENGFLLRGKDLDDAEQQLVTNANKDPRPTDLQREYVLKSRQGNTRQRRITMGILIGLIAGMLGVIFLLVRPYVEESIARKQAQDLSTMMTVPAGSIDFYLIDRSQTIDLPEFHIELHPVTNRVYGLCVKVDKCTPPVGSADFNHPAKTEDPVVWVTIVQATTYCKWIGRRLPSAPEWEQAVGNITSPSPDESFALSAHYEWTSSYLTETAPGSLSKWDENLDNVNIVDWFFLQEYGSVNPDKSLEMYTNPSGAFGANADLGFRCAQN
ncbi:MAG TPA: TIR domain-containing protein [Anaerolineales bacterium]|nr:TIR domain-containing protein [Anaerolineales bacterium]